MKNLRVAISAHVKSICLCLAAVFCAWLAYSAFLASQTHVLVDSTDSVFGNPYIVKQKSATVRLEASTLDQQLEFMVWDRERRLLSFELSELLRQQINIEPFDFELWRRLSFAELGAARSSAEHAFALRQALILGKWNSNRRIELLHHCVLNFSNLERVIPNLCRLELNSLPEGINLHWVATRAGVSFDQLNAMLARAGVAKPKLTRH